MKKKWVVEEGIGIKLREMIEKNGGGISGGWENMMEVIKGGE